MIQHSLEIVGKRKFEWLKKELSVIGEDEVLVKTIATAISIGDELSNIKKAV